jgi:hypothetical protein
MSDPLPDHYRDTTRVLLRFAIVMTVVGLLSGVASQESAKRLDLEGVDPGFRLQATIHLALVHGHLLVACVLLPVALAGMLHLAGRAGGATVGPRATKFLTRGFLPFVTLAVALMLYKGYHFLLLARAGERSLAAIDGRFFGGIAGLRHGIYGVVHTGMAVTLAVFLVALFRSLRRR